MIGAIMREAHRIKDQLKRAHEGEAWHGPSLMELIADITFEQAAAHPINGAHSIWEIILHITAWESAVMKRIDGEAVELSGEQDWPAVINKDEKSWHDSISALKHINLALRA